MKTAENYAHELCCHLTKCGSGISYLQERELKRIIQETMPTEQLNAMKEGMQRAAKLPAEMVIGGRAWSFEQKIAGNALLECESAILATAKQLTEKDL